MWRRIFVLRYVIILHLYSARGNMKLHGNELTGESGEIASPLYPRPYIQQGDYYWRITVEDGMAVRIIFTDFYMDVIYSTECYIFLEVYDGADDKSPSLLRACGANLPSPVTSSSNVVYIRFYSDPVVHGSYFHLSWQQTLRKETDATIHVDTLPNCTEIAMIGFRTGQNVSYPFTSPGFPGGYGSNKHCEWIIETTPDNHIALSFSVVDLEEDYYGCTADFIEIFDGTNDRQGWTKKSHLCLLNETSQTFYGTNLMKVVFESDVGLNGSGFSAVAKTVCGGSLTGPGGTLDTRNITQHGAYVSTIECQWTITVRAGRTIHITFDYINLPGVPNQQTCSSNYVLLLNGGHSDSPLLGNGKYCGVILPVVPKTSSNRLYVSYSAELAAQGMVMTYEEVSFACGGDKVLTAEHNKTSFTSPNYPNIPVPHTSCTWKILAPPGETVHFDFVDRFDLTHSPGCAVEYIEIRDGATELSPLFGKYCLSTPNYITSTGNSLFVKFFTDTDTPKNGFSAVAHIADCGGTFFRAYRGTIKSPNYPDTYPANTDCVWRIVVYDGATITLNFTELDLGSESNCSGEEIDYLEIRDTDRTILDLKTQTRRVCGRTQESITSVSNEMYVHFHSQPNRRGSSNRKFSITFSSSRKLCGGKIEAPSGIIESPGYSSGMHNFRYCLWMITVPKGRKITLKFLDLDFDEVKNNWPLQRLSLYNDEYYSVLIGFLTGNLPAGTTYESSGNKMGLYYIKRHGSSHRGFKAEFSSDKAADCGGTLEEDSGTIHSPSSDSSYYCVWERTSERHINSTFTLYFTVSTNTTSVDDCDFLGNQIVVSTFDMDLAKLCRKYDTPFAVRSPYSDLRIVGQREVIQNDLHMQQNSRNSSFNFTFTYKTSPCGGLLSGPENIITSPGYPGSYPANVDCAWRVEVDVGQTITVKFEVMDLEPDCDHDFLSLYNGMLPSDPHIGKFCGNVIPANLTTQYNSLWIEFHSDAAIQHHGFVIAVTASNKGCGGILGGNHGSISSPGYPAQYPVNVECEWEIHVQPGFHVVLNFFSRFHIETSVNCGKDYIQVSDYQDGRWIPIQRVCGRHFPDPINSTSNVMKILFHSDDKTVGDGFEASWSVNCGAVISVNGEGVIISPNFPERYLPSLYCNYTLLAPSEFMTGEFTSFSLEEGVAGKCIYDNVTVYVSPISNSPYDYEYDDGDENQVTYCGIDLPPRIRAKDRITLVFQTDGWTEAQGFFFKYNVDRCHQNITKPTIISSGENGYYGHHQNCSWLITAPADRIIILRIRNFRLEYGSRCQYDYLDIYDGLPNRNDSRHVGKFCGTSIPSRIRSTKSHMLLRFVSDESISTAGFTISVTYSFGESSGCGGTKDISPNVPLTITSLDADHDGNYESFLDCTWFIEAPLSHILSVQFDKLDIDNCTNLQNASCHCDYLSLHDGDSEQSDLIGKYCGNVPVPNVMTSTNQLYAQFVSDGTSNKPGFKVTIKAEISPCGPAFLDVSTDSKTLTSPGYPANYPNNIRCRWTLHTNLTMNTIRLHFTDFDMEISEKCTHDYLTLSDTGSDRLRNMLSAYNRPQLGRGRSTKLCGKRANDYVSTTNTVQVIFYSDSQRTGKGFQLTYSAPGCNFNYTEPQGRIVSQRLSQTCTIRITAPSENATISLYFSSFFLLSFDQCQTTKMRIFDGASENSPVIASLCGRQTPDPLFSSGPALYILINSLISLGRYDMSYTTTDQGRGCGGRLSDFDGMFTSQLYPTVYRNSSVCRWQITVPHGYGIYLSFLVFNLAPRSLCRTDHIEFYEINEETATETFHSRLCGGETPATQMFTSSSVAVKYVTSEHNTGSGWVIHYRAHS